MRATPDKGRIQVTLDDGRKVTVEPNGKVTAHDADGNHRSTIDPFTDR